MLKMEPMHVGKCSITELHLQPTTFKKKKKTFWLFCSNT